MRLDEDFAFIPSDADKPSIGQEFEGLVGGQVADIDVTLTKHLRNKYEGLNVTAGKLNISSLR